MITLQFPELARHGQLEVLEAIGRGSGCNVLCFGGGTALSLVYFGHRISVDLDFFTANRDDFEMGLQAVMGALRALDYRFDLDRLDTQATLRIDFGERKLKIDVLLDDLIEDTSCPRLTDYGVRVLPVETLAALKIEAAISRSQLDRLKDVFDLLVIEGSGHVSIGETARTNPRQAGELLEALEELDDLIGHLSELRPQRGFGDDHSALLRRKNLLVSNLMKHLG